MTDGTSTPEPDAGTRTGTGTEDDQGAALDRAAEAIHEAQDAEASVAAQDDITTLDAARAGEYSEDPNGEGGHP